MYWKVVKTLLISYMAKISLRERFTTVNFSLHVRKLLLLPTTLSGILYCGLQYTAN